MPIGHNVSDRIRAVFDTPSPVALVTGSAAPRVGHCITQHLLAEGFRIVYHRHQDNTQVASGITPSESNALCVSGSVEDENNVRSWVEEIQEHFGRCDLLVNSAAVWDPQPLETSTAADFRRHFDVNALGTALTCKHFGLAMTRQPSGGAIVNIGDWALRRPYRDFAAYFASKGAVQAITESMAVELAIRNPRVRVNAVFPGPVKMAESITAEHRAKLASECLLQREGTADDVAQAVLYLATSPFVTGVCLPVDGGRSIYAGRSFDAIAHPDYRPEPE